MKSYLKSIVLLGKDGSRRIVPLKKGVNIITGDSKTGKSALVEIIDYCLCSSHCSVPKGIITDYTSMYCIILCIDEKQYLIARQNAMDGGAIFYTEVNEHFAGVDICREFFSTLKPSPLKEVQYKIEAALGMTVTNIHGIDEISRKPSLRNMVSYLFQHQNLIASKFALFYRFTDFSKRKDVIDQFPVFAGLVDQQYYSDLIHIETLKAELRTKKLAQTRMQKRVNYVQQHLLPLVKNYYALLGMPFPTNRTSQQIVSLAKKLPAFDDSILYEDDGIVQRYHELHTLLEQKRDERRETLSRIETLKSTGNYGSEYDKTLIELQEKTEFASPKATTYVCPLCGTHNEEIELVDEQVQKASQWLSQEIYLTAKYSQSFAEDIRKLQELSDNLRSEINHILEQIRLIEKKYIKSHELVTLREKVNYAKSQIQLYIDTIDLKDDDDFESEIERIQTEIERLKRRISGYDVEKKIEKAESFLNMNMNRLARTLDFEDEYKPIDLNFSIANKTFDLYHHQKDREKIFLFEMGSGANWLSCHLALFLSLLYYFASQENSPMPMFMFFDQPSQVYFPQGLTEQSEEKESYSSDLAAVNRIYKTMFDEIERIFEKTGIMPQLIVVDHVSSEVIDEKERFENALRCEWRNGRKLI